MKKKQAGIVTPIGNAEPIPIDECRRILGSAFKGSDAELAKVRDAMQPMAELVAKIILAELRGEVAVELTARNYSAPAHGASRQLVN